MSSKEKVGDDTSSLGCASPLSPLANDVGVSGLSELDVSVWVVVFLVGLGLGLGLARRGTPRRGSWAPCPRSLENVRMLAKSYRCDERTLSRHRGPLDPNVGRGERGRLVRSIKLLILLF